MMTGNTAIHIASQLQSGAPRKAAFLVAVHKKIRLSSCSASVLTTLFHQFRTLRAFEARRLLAEEALPGG